MKRLRIKYTIIGILIGIILSIPPAYAAIVYNSSQVSYNNTTSGLNSSNVKNALDEVSGNCNVFIFQIQYKKTNNQLITYTFETTHGTTWAQFAAAYNATHADSEFYIEGRVYEVSYTPSNTLGEGYVRKTSGNGSNIALGSEIVLPQTYFVTEDDYCCFDPETLITIDYEGHTKKIKDFEVGDTILVENVKTREKLLTTVVKDASEHPDTYKFTELTMEDGTKLKFNSYHPIYTTEGYKSITNYNGYPTLEKGDYTVTLTGKRVKIVNINNYKVPKPQMTYNLLIKGINEDFLEEEYAYIANDKLVHTGIAEYDDEDEWRENNRINCTHQELYKDFDYDKASDQEVIDFLVYLYKQNPEAEKEYIKFYLTADQYFRYTEFAREVKDRIKNKDYNFQSNPYGIKNKNAPYLDMNDKTIKRVFE